MLHSTKNLLAVLTTLLVMSFPGCENAAVPDADKRNLMLYNSHMGADPPCEVGSTLVASGQVFRDPALSGCLTFRCELGTPVLHSEACEGEGGACHAVGETWDEQCVTFVCTKTTVHGYNYFQPIVSTAKCQDVNGECHSPGDTFPYRLYGQLYQSCRCSIYGHRISYRCY